MKSGVIVLNKESGMTSHTAVRRLSRLLGAEKAGHTGTLDPMAEGVLPVLIERAVKASEFMLTDDKHYRAVLTLGITTDTEDESGNVLTESNSIPDTERVLSAIQSFVGKIKQTPPMYSALKVGGKKLCDLARQGVTVEREAREITVYSIDAERIDDKNYSLSVHCSKGTYIRTLCADIGAALGCGGIMSRLTRTECCGFALDTARTLSEIENMSESEREALVFPTEYIFRGLPKLCLSEFFSKLARSGLEIYLKKIGLFANVGERFSLYDSSGVFFAVGEVKEYEAGLAVKPIKQFS